MEYLIGAIWVGLELLCVILFSGSFLQKSTVKKGHIVAVVALWGLVCVYTNLGINHFTKQLLIVIIYAVISRMLYCGTFTVHICLAVIEYIFVAAIDTIAINGICFILHTNYNEFIWQKIPYILLITADKLVAVLMAWKLNRSRKIGAIGKHHGKWVQLSMLFPMASAAILAILFYISPRDGDVPIATAVFAGILIIANIAMIYVINNIEMATEQEQDLRLLRQQISIQAENYGALKKNYCIQRKSTHEFERHIQVLRDLLERKEYESAYEYVRQLQADRTLKVYCIASNNPVVDVVLNQKHQIAQEHRIKMQVKVNDLSSVGIQANKLVVLLSNLLENAIEACLKLKNDREIVCSIVKEDSIYISIRNTSPPVKIIHGEIATTKQDATEHGYGLPAVKYILDQLSAEYTFAYQDGWFQFVAEIPE